MAITNRATTDKGYKGFSDGEIPPGADTLEYTNEWLNSYDASGNSTSSAAALQSPITIGKYFNVAFFPNLSDTTSIPTVEVWARKASSAGPVVTIKVWRKSGGWGTAIPDPSLSGTLLGSTTMQVSGSATLHQIALGSLYPLKELCVEVVCATGLTPTLTIYDVLFLGTRAKGILVL